MYTMTLSELQTGVGFVPKFAPGHFSFLAAFAAGKNTICDIHL